MRQLWQIQKTSERVGEVVCEPGLMTRGALTEAVTGARQVLLVHDPMVAEYARIFSDRLRREGRSVVTKSWTMDEQGKNLKTLSRIYAWFGENLVRRDSLVVAMGGGVLTDTVGFAAATYLRGIAWVAVPTTLLGQVDAAIGGKVAINLPHGKNLAGAFHLPATVYVDPDILKTLPLIQWQAGVGEVMKTALIAGGALYKQLNGSVVRFGDPIWPELIAHTIRYKVEIVNQDLEESGPRLYLNFGHTTAHGLEQALGYGTLTHGAAVGLGCRVALVLSETILGLDPKVRTQVESWMRMWQMPMTLSGVDWDRVLAAIGQDKKATSYGQRWILLEQIGKPKVQKGIDPTLVRRILADVLDTPLSV